jgi:O-antigen/teichoic acid export membrane protein
LYILRAELLITIIVFILTLLFATIIQYKYYLWFFFGALAIFPLCFDILYSAAIRGMQEYGIITKSELFASLFKIICIIVAFLLKFDTGGFLLVILLSTLISFALRFYFWERKFSHISLQPVSKDIKHELKKYACVMFSAGIVSSVVWERSEIFFLERFSPVSQISFYNIAYSLVQRLGDIPASLAATLFPATSAFLARNDFMRIRQLYILSLKYLGFLVIPSCVGMVAIGYPAIKIFYGQAFIEAVPILNILAMFRAIALVGAPLSAIIIGLKGEVFLLVMGIVTAALNIILDITIIPYHHAIGAAYANSFSQIIAIVISFIYIYKKYKFTFPFINLLKVFTASLAMLPVSWVFYRLMGYTILSMFLVMIAAVIVYLVAVKLLKLFNQGDYDYLIKLQNRLPFFLRSKINLFMGFLINKKAL